ncbi:MAG: hypothetical protein EB037_09200, partial [Actinobacteria bacterium]|nr:hypothetical protein [Actinomycetota bacterium]
WWAFVGAIPLGVGGAGFLSSFNGLVQQKCPADMRGRLLALSAVAFLGSTPIGGPITGVIADSWGAEWALAYGSLISLVAVAVAFIALMFTETGAETVAVTGAENVMGKTDTVGSK